MSPIEYKYFSIEEIIQNENIWRVTSECHINNFPLKKYLRKYIYFARWQALPNKLLKNFYKNFLRKCHQKMSSI